jgi:UMP-CMP kinase
MATTAAATNTVTSTSVSATAAELKEGAANKRKLIDGKAEVAFVLGGPGAGKGTQCLKIVENFGKTWVHLSAGDLLRAEKSTKSANADVINACIKNGSIVPSAITVSLLLQAMRSSPGKKFLIDGFPRNEENRETWYRLAEGQTKVVACLFYECGMAELERRLLERGKTSGRADDNLESIKLRFITFQNESMPILEWFQEEKLLKNISGARPVDDVWAETKEFLESLH